jgi:Na+/proline symporter
MGAFFFQRATTAGGIASIGSGMVMTLIWEIWNLKDNVFQFPLVGETTIPTIYPSLIMSIVGLILVSYLTKPPSNEKIEKFKTKRQQARENT